MRQNSRNVARATAQIRRYGVLALLVPLYSFYWLFIVSDAFLFRAIVAGIFVGADSMSRAVAVPTYIADVIVALALLSMLVTTMLSKYRVRWR